MPTAYAIRGIRFKVPDTWGEVDDDLDETIRSITIDAPSGGYCMLDLYQVEQAPSLDRYIENQIEHYLRALPRGYRIVGKPVRSTETAVHRGREVKGERVWLDVRTFWNRHPDLNSFFRLDLGRLTGLCSLRCPEEEFDRNRVRFGEFLESLESEES